MGNSLCNTDTCNNSSSKEVLCEIEEHTLSNRSVFVAYEKKPLSLSVSFKTNYYKTSNIALIKLSQRSHENPVRIGPQYPLRV